MDDNVNAIYTINFWIQKTITEASDGATDIHFSDQSKSVNKDLLRFAIIRMKIAIDTCQVAALLIDQLQKKVPNQQRQQE